MKDTDSIEYAHKRSLELIEEAWKLVEGLQFESNEAKERLREFATMLIERKSWVMFHHVILCYGNLCNIYNFAIWMIFVKYFFPIS